MSDCQEVITMKRIQALLQTALEATTLNGSISNVATTIVVTAYPKMWPASGNFSFIVGTETIVVTAGHGTTSLTVTRAAGVAHTTGATCTKTPSRVYLSIKDLDVNADFFNSIVITPAIQVRPAFRSGQDYMGHTKYSVPVRVYYGYPKNADNDYTAFINMNALVGSTLGTEGNYIGATKGPPTESDIEWNKPEEEIINTNGVSVKYELTLPFVGSI